MDSFESKIEIFDNDMKQKSSNINTFSLVIGIFRIVGGILLTLSIVGAGWGIPQVLLGTKQIGLGKKIKNMSMNENINELDNVVFDIASCGKLVIIGLVAGIIVYILAIIILLFVMIGIMSYY